MEGYVRLSVRGGSYSLARNRRDMEVMMQRQCDCITTWEHYWHFVDQVSDAGCCYCISSEAVARLEARAKARIGGTSWVG